MSEPTPHTASHGGDVYHLARTLGLDLTDLLDFSANINSLGFPAGLHSATQELEFLLEGLAALPGLTPFPSAVNYLLVKLNRPGATAASLQQQMLRHHIVIRDASNFRGLDARYFRIAVRSRQENGRLLKALKECLEF